MSEQPSEAAVAFATERIKVVEDGWYPIVRVMAAGHKVAEMVTHYDGTTEFAADGIARDLVNDFAQLFDQFAAQAVAAERARITNALLHDIEQDVIADMYAGDHKFTRSDIVWNQALETALKRIRVHRKE